MPDGDLLDSSAWDRDVDMRHAIGAGQELSDVPGADDAAGAQIGSDVDAHGGPQAENRPVPPARDLEVATHVAGMADREKMFAPILDPLDRTVQGAGNERDEEVLGEEFAPHAEATAGIAFDHGDGAFGKVHQLGENPPVRERNLRGAADGHMTFRIVPFGE